MKCTVLRVCGILSLLYTGHSAGAIIVQGDNTNPPRGFSQEVNAQVYDMLRGDFYVGLQAGADDYALAKARRPNFHTTPKFTAIASSSVADSTVELLAFSQQTKTLPVLAVVLQSGGNDFQATHVLAQFTNGTAATSAMLNDAAGNTTSGIIDIAASSCHIFSAVAPFNDVWGQTDSGIALTEIVPGDKSSTLELKTKNATTGQDNNQAAPLQRDSVVLTGGTTDVIFTDTSAALHWDEELQRLYIGVLITTNGNDDDIGKAVVAARLDPSLSNRLLLEEIVANSALDPDENQIIVAKNKAGTTFIDLSAKHIRTMNTSTGPSYLIVNGTREDLTSFGNKIRALPLVNDPSNPTKHGTLAKEDAPLSDFKFVTPATGMSDLLTDDNPVAQVGAGDLPIEPSTQISDIMVVGDAVYVSIATPPSTGNDTGIFYSQALFDKNGKTVRWTPWTKRAVPFNAFPGVELSNCAQHDGGIQFFAVDAKTGNIWIVEATTRKVVGITSWSKGILESGLTNQLNIELCDGSYAVLDLDQATRGFQGETEHRYALFGGTNQVVFARISQAEDINDLSSPQTVIDDFADTQNFLQTNLPQGAGCSQALEYSRTSATAGNAANLNYFFAGTETGLFAFADGNGNGFSALELSTLDQPPFTNHSWQKIDTITGNVVDIKTSGNGNLYVLVTESTVLEDGCCFTKPPCTNTTSKEIIKSTLYSIPFTNNIATMFDPSNIRIIAQTGVDIFENVIEFFGIQIIATSEPGAINYEQLLLATNQGLFRSNAEQNAYTGIEDALDQGEADWQLITNTATTFFNGIAGIDTPTRHTVWPFSVQDETRCKTFERGTIHQLSANGSKDDPPQPCFNTDDPFTPEHFNARPLTQAFETLDPITYFFSDGGRRFFVFNRVQDPPTQNRIGVIPFDIALWNATMPTVLTHPVLNTVCRFYWIKQVGVSGLLMAGTGCGVVSLE